SHCGCWIRRCSEARLMGIPARCSRRHSSAKMLSMKRSSRVSFASQCTTSPSECVATGPMSCGESISCSRTVISIGGTGYVVSPRGGVNGASMEPAPEERREDVEHFIRLVVVKPVAGALDLDQFGLLEMRDHAGRCGIGQETLAAADQERRTLDA